MQLRHAKTRLAMDDVMSIARNGASKGKKKEMVLETAETVETVETAQKVKVRGNMIIW